MDLYDIPKPVRKPLALGTIPPGVARSTLTPLPSDQESTGMRLIASLRMMKILSLMSMISHNFKN